MTIPLFSNCRLFTGFLPLGLCYAVEKNKIMKWMSCFHKQSLEENLPLSTDVKQDFKLSQPLTMNYKDDFKTSILKLCLYPVTITWTLRFIVFCIMFCTHWYCIDRQRKIKSTSIRCPVECIITLYIYTIWKAAVVSQWQNNSETTLLFCVTELSWTEAGRHSSDIW